MGLVRHPRRQRATPRPSSSTGPGLPDVDAGLRRAARRELAEPYDLEPAAVEAFAREAFVRLPGVLSPAVVRRLAERLEELLRAEHGDDVAGRFTALEQMWLHDDLMREVALSPRIGGLAAALLGEPGVRLYHDNALSKEPGCGRTPWHHDAEHFPLQTVAGGHGVDADVGDPGRMGPLSFARGREVREQVADLEFDKVGTSYDAAVAAAVRRAQVSPSRPSRSRSATSRSTPRCASTPPGRT